MTEADFIERIDFNFPYADFDLASQLISQAGEVSQNAVYAVLHEILRAPPHIELATKELLLNMWLTDYEQDPLFYLIRRCIPAYIKNELVPVNICLQLIERLTEQPKQFSLLSLLVFACDDVSGEVKAASERTLASWS